MLYAFLMVEKTAQRSYPRSPRKKATRSESLCDSSIDSVVNRVSRALQYCAILKGRLAVFLAASTYWIARPERGKVVASINCSEDESVSCRYVSTESMGRAQVSRSERLMSNRTPMVPSADEGRMDRKFRVQLVPDSVCTLNRRASHSIA